MRTVLYLSNFCSLTRGCIRPDCECVIQCTVLAELLLLSTWIKVQITHTKTTRVGLLGGDCILVIDLILDIAIESLLATRHGNIVQKMFPEVKENNGLKYGFFK